MIVPLHGCALKNPTFCSINLLALSLSLSLGTTRVHMITCVFVICFIAMCWLFKCCSLTSNRYKAIARSLYIQERTSGARPYNIISWLKEPPCRTLPPFPKDIGPPPPSGEDPNKIPLNASKGPLSFAYTYGPFGTIPWGTPWLYVVSVL